MSRYFCHEHPDVLILETRVVDARPGAVVLEQSPFHPGGGGQLADRGFLRWTGGELRVTGIEAAGGRYWHLLAEPVELTGPVETVVDPAFRSLMAQLHTDTHILNALVFQHFQGALVTGAQLNEDGTARMDFDLPEADNDRLRALEPEINDVIRQDLPLRYAYVTEAEALAERGLIRNRSVAPPPTSDGTIRVVEIVGLDRQACGGTHLGSTAGSRPVRILKIDNKGRHNRRIKIGFAGESPR
ncbi:MAG TPA: alanyl-tRNA editing protein [Candidatus Deferrimicrobiaceae bacterium]|nr:alanyl-tRNA editing protein [Candidatus Deferrimicrobiaceae bacterium]